MYRQNARMSKEEIRMRFEQWWNLGGSELGLIPIRVPKTASTSLSVVINEYAWVKLRSHNTLPMMPHITVSDINTLSRTYGEYI